MNEINYSYTIASYHRQLSMEIKKIKHNTTGINSIILLLLVDNCLLYIDAIHEFSVWPRTGSNPADIYRFRSHAGLDHYKNFIKFISNLIYPLRRTRLVQRLARSCSINIRQTNTHPNTSLKGHNAQ